MATLAVPIHEAEEAFNPNAVKWSLMPAAMRSIFHVRPFRGIANVTRSRVSRLATRCCAIGIYAYRAGFIRRYVAWQPCALEQIELLEQLRVLWYGEKIHVAVAATVPSVGVDTPDDLLRVREAMQAYRQRPAPRLAVKFDLALSFAPS